MAKFIENTGSVSQDESLYPAHFNTLNYVYLSVFRNWIESQPPNQLPCSGSGRGGGGNRAGYSLREVKGIRQLAAILRLEGGG